MARAALLIPAFLLLAGLFGLVNVLSVEGQVGPQSQAYAYFVGFPTVTPDTTPHNINIAYQDVGLTCSSVVLGLAGSAQIQNANGNWVSTMALPCHPGGTNITVPIRGNSAGANSITITTTFSNGNVTPISHSFTVQSPTPTPTPTPLPCTATIGGGG